MMAPSVRLYYTFFNGSIFVVGFSCASVYDINRHDLRSKFRIPVDDSMDEYTTWMFYYSFRFNYKPYKKWMYFSSVANRAEYGRTFHYDSGMPNDIGNA